MKIEKLEILNDREQIMEGFRGILILPKDTVVDPSIHSKVYNLGGALLPDIPVHGLRVVLVEEMGEGEDFIVMRDGSLVI